MGAEPEEAVYTQSLATEFEVVAEACAAVGGGLASGAIRAAAGQKQRPQPCFNSQSHAPRTHNYHWQVPEGHAFL